MQTDQTKLRRQHNRLNNRVFWWEPWEEHCFFLLPRWEVQTAALHGLRKSFAEPSKFEKASPIDPHVAEAGFVECVFNTSAVTQDNMHLRDQHLGYTVGLQWRVNILTVDSSRAAVRILADMQKCAAWLESDPLIHDLHLSQHRWNVVAEGVRRDALKQAEVATLRAASPAFTPRQAKALVDNLRTTAANQYKAELRLIGRPGTRRAHSHYRIEAASEDVRSPQGGWQARTKYKFDGRAISTANLLDELQKHFSPAQNINWAGEIK